MPNYRHQKVQPLLDYMSIYLTVASHPEGLKCGEVAAKLGKPARDVYSRLAALETHGLKLWEDENERLHAERKAFVGYASLVFPDELEDEIIQVSSDIDTGYWQLGDITVRLVDQLGDITDEKGKRVYKKSFIRSKVAHIAGAKVATIRDCEWMSRRIPREKRNYTPLTRHGYKACLAAGDDWEKFAKKAVESMDEYGGRLPPVDKIRAWANGSPQAEVEKWRRMWEKMLDIAEDLSEEEEAPENIRLICTAVVKSGGME